MWRAGTEEGEDTRRVTKSDTRYDDGLLYPGYVMLSDVRRVRCSAGVAGVKRRRCLHAE